MNKYNNVDYQQIDKWVESQEWSNTTKKNRRTIIARAMSLINSGLDSQQAYDEITRGITYGSYVASTLEPFFAQHGYGTIVRAGRSKVDMGKDIRTQQQRHLAGAGELDNARVMGRKRDVTPLNSNADNDGALSSTENAGRHTERVSDPMTSLRTTGTPGSPQRMRVGCRQDGLDAARDKIVSILTGDPDGLRVFEMMEADIGAVDSLTLSYIAYHLKDN